MISIYVILSGVFAILAIISYHFSSDSYSIYKCVMNIHGDDIVRKEHKLYHVIFATLLCITTTLLSILYISAVVCTTAFSELLFLVPTILIIKHIVMVIFASTCLLFLKHVIDEQRSDNRMFIERKVGNERRLISHRQKH